MTTHDWHISYTEEYDILSAMADSVYKEFASRMDETERLFVLPSLSCSVNAALKKLCSVSITQQGVRKAAAVLIDPFIIQPHACLTESLLSGEMVTYNKISWVLHRARGQYDYKHN